MRLKSLQERVQSELLADQRACRPVLEVQQWQMQYTVCKRRYKFLVLDGPSQMGKTEFVKSLVPPKRVLELNMAASVEPDLRSYDHEAHDLILFDECGVEAVLRQRRLFQAPPVMVGLGSSPTNMHVYNVWVHRKMLVIATNKSSRRLAQCEDDDRKCLLANCVYYPVIMSMWFQGEAADLP